MPICENCNCYTNDHIYPQWKPQGTTWCSQCLDNHRQQMNVEVNQVLNLEVNPNPEGITG